nr:hypothetical protein [Prolixibacteraceae bacterium]
DIQFTFEYAEPFGEVELFGSRYNGDSPLVIVKLDSLNDMNIDGNHNLSIPRSWGDVNTEMRFNSIFPYEFAGLSSVHTIGENLLYDNYELLFKLGFIYRNDRSKKIEKSAKYSYIDI